LFTFYITKQFEEYLEKEALKIDFEDLLY